MKKYRIEGLDCPKCAVKIEDRLERSGINAKIDFSSATVVIYGENNHSLDELNEIIKEQDPELSLLEHSKIVRDFPVVELTRLIVSTALLLIAIALSTILHGDREFLEYGLFVIAYLVAGGNTFLRALKNLLRGDFFDENFLMTVATLGAFLIHELPEAVAVMIFYSLGELLESLALRKSRRSVKELIDFRADEVVQMVDGVLKTVPAREIRPGDRFIVRVGDRIPIDGVIDSGSTSLDKSLLTGESDPVLVGEGDAVIAGTLNKSGVIEVVASATLEKSYTSRMLELVEEGTLRKSSKERFITRFSRIYTPFVILIAASVAIFPPLLLGGTISEWLHRALILLVISCPCALVISVPLSYFIGIGKASREGILFKGSNYLESLGKVDSIFFDKTGTLTKGKPEITRMEKVGQYSERELLEYAALIESYSTHPIADRFVRLVSEIPSYKSVSNYSEIAGKGVKAEVDGKEISVGNYRLLEDLGIEYKGDNGSNKLFMVIDSSIEGVFELSDALKDDSSEALARLRKLGIKEIVMLTGDHYDAAASVSTSLELDGFVFGATPEEKMNIVESALRRGKHAAFVGDGINDAPVIARADVGIAIGNSGADATIETADVVLSSDSLTKVARAIELSRLTNTIAIQNIVISLGIKILFICLGALGLLNMWGAVFADVGVTLVAVMNSLRLLRE